MQGGEEDYEKDLVKSSGQTVAQKISGGNKLPHLRNRPYCWIHTNVSICRIIFCKSKTVDPVYQWKVCGNKSLLLLLSLLLTFRHIKDTIFGHWCPYFRILVLSSVTFKMTTNNYFFSKIFATYFLKLHLHNFLKIKSHIEVTKQ
jgi:hypothetical protein